MEASALSAPAGLRRESHTSPWLRLRSDEQLVGLFRSGSEDAFRVIHDRYRQRLFAYSRQMLGGSGSDAEDVMQDVFMRAYRALRVDARPVSLRAWLYRVAHNRCIDGLRRPVPAASDIFEMSRTPVVDPMDAVERREDLQRLVEDVRRLPEQQRSALLMREMDGLSYADLAAALETSIPAVKSLLVRARIGLVEAIEARDADCADIRHDLAASYDRGVRTSGRARRHLRDCDNCASYRAQLRCVRQGFAALSPGAAAPGLIAKLLGFGGATSGAGAAAGGAASGTTVAIGGSAAAAVSVGKVATIVCCAAALTGGAVEVRKIVAPEVSPSPRQALRVAGAAAVAPALAGAADLRAERAAQVRVLVAPAAGGAGDVALHPPVAMSPSLAPVRDNGNGAGGAQAPAGTALEDEPPASDAPADQSTDGDVIPVTGDILPLDGDSGTQSPGTTGASTGSGTSGSGSGTGSGTANQPSSGSSPGSGSGGTTSGGDTATTSSTSGSGTSGSTAPSGSGSASSPGTGSTAGRS
ncbi:MAG: polymerase, sigma-24 subunit, subfamily [Solirubrobacterales bacterium]|nr:polymerase, sigma-24 subunit, subfamily [Solirubrobacterales bacterium]